MIPRVIILQFFCLLLLATGFVSRGANDDYLVDVWTSENGLPDSSVTAIAQTPDGYLWAGTYNGLVRFDGVRFVTFDPANTPALAHARVRKLFVDANGTLWIDTYDGSLTTFRNGTFTYEYRTVRFSEGDLMLVYSSTKEVVFLTGRGDIFRKTLRSPPGEGWTQLPPPPPGRGIGSLSCADGHGGIWYRDGDKHLWRLDGNQFVSVPESAGVRNVNYLTTDPQGTIWVATDHEICAWNGERFEKVIETPSPATFLAIDSNNQVWAVINGSICTANDGRWIYGPAAKRNVFSGNPNRIGALEDGHGGMWFYNYGRGLMHVADGRVEPLTAGDGFPGERVYCLVQDTEGDWWSGLDSGGLVRIRERQFHVPEDSGHAAKSISQGADGSVWVGMLSGGLGRWQDGDWTNFPSDSIFCVCPDAQGRLWVSAGDEDLFLRENGVVRQVTPVLHGVKSILADRSGRIWFGTTSGLFISTNGSPGQIEPFTTFGRHTVVRALAEDRQGNIWVGTGGGDLFKISGETMSVLHPRDSQAAAGAIWAVLPEDNGDVWVGTFRDGLFRLRDGKFTRFAKKEGLPDNIICQILDDGHGNLWVGSHQGIFRVAKSALDDFADGKIKFIPSVDYARSDGLPSLECSGGYQPSAWRDRDGRLWFATARGATWILPSEIQPNSTPPPVVIEEVLVDGKAIEAPVAATNEYRRTSIFKPPMSLVIPPGKHQIEFRYTGLSLASPERVQFRYQLSPVDEDWVLAGTRRSVQYNLLPPGEYRFRVIACNSDGVWNETGAELRTEIRPHFYETWWFRTLVIVLLLGTVAGIVRHTATRRLREQMEILARKQMVEQERARIAKDIHDDLGASLTLIAVLGDLAQKEKVGERVEKMSATAREAVKSLDEIVWAVNPRNDTLGHLIDYTGQFAADYLRDAGIRCLLDVPDHAPAREVPANVRHNLFLVVKEGLQNIVKHAQAKEVWLRISAGDRQLRIEIEDNGRGFEHAPVNGWADGLRNMRQRLAEIGGECTIQSSPGKGTTIRVTLSLADGVPLGFSSDDGPGDSI